MLLCSEVGALGVESRPSSIPSRALAAQSGTEHCRTAADLQNMCNVSGLPSCAELAGDESQINLGGQGCTMGRERGLDGVGRSG